MKDRYFTVWFKGYDTEGDERNGSMQVIGKKGNFINEEEVVAIIVDNFELTGIFIKNYQEFPSEKDFKTYVHKKKGTLSRFKFW